MRVHWFQHVPFEGLGLIQPWLHEKNATVTATRFFADDPLPVIDDFDWLIVMGGPMGVNDTDVCPWLAAEQTLIAEAIRQGKTVLGICLGAQLIAAALGARVYRNTEKEIGWFAVNKSNTLNGHWLSRIFPEEFTPLHWHGETFDLPPDAVLLGSSAACRNQGFCYRDRVIALQFHLEMGHEHAAAIAQHCAAELQQSTYIQTAEAILNAESCFQKSGQLMRGVLDGMFYQSNSD